MNKLFYNPYTNQLGIGPIHEPVTDTWYIQVEEFNWLFIESDLNNWELIGEL